jgi:hypothetical protein
MRNQAGLIRGVVKLGSVIRRFKAEGKMLSTCQPTIYGYLAFVRMAVALPHLSLLQVAEATLLGNASQEDRRMIPGVFHEAFGLTEVKDASGLKSANLL